MNILIIGGTGFLGPFVVRQLVELGHTVTIFHTGEHEGDLPPQVRHVHHPSAKHPTSGIPAELKTPAPDVIILLHPNGEEDATLVMREFKGIAKRVVAISSIDVYRAFSRANGFEPGPPDPTPLTEDSPLRDKRYPYRSDEPATDEDPRRKAFDAYDKILVEEAIFSDPDMPGTSLRLPMIYGPGDRQHRLADYLTPMDDGRTSIPLDENLAGWRAPRGYVENVAWAITLAATNDHTANRVYNVAEPNSLSIAEFAQRIGTAIDWPGAIVLVPPGKMEMPLNTDQQWTTSSDRIRQELGYSEIVPLDEALRRTIEWERATRQPTLPDAYAEDDRILAELTAGAD